ncbi:hypothetical protein GGI07_005754 [Coemansia sp. Benny D115]|nr:hypothetical protein GGI07_005754 [Coemansia sp. Benny D115]
MLKAAAAYMIQGRRLPSWDLKLQVMCDVVRQYGIETFKETSDDDIHKLDYQAIHNRFRGRDVPKSQVQAKTGTYTTLSIDPTDIDIDIDAIKGIGVAEQPLLELIQQYAASTADSAKQELDYELVTTWGLCTKHGMGPDNHSAALQPDPLDKDEKILLCFHGGAYVMGSPASHRETMAIISDLVHMRAFVIDYRLAPKHPFPAQLLDALVSVLYLMKRGFKPQNIVLVGDSAGGHLCIDLAMLMNHMKMDPVGAIVLICPMTAIDLKGPSLQSNRPFDYLHPYPHESPTSPIRLFYKPGHRYTEQYRKELQDPLLTPINGSLANFPPTLVQSGSKELLVDDIREFYDKLLKDNNGDASLMVYEEYPDMVHVFHRFHFRPESAQAFEAISKFILDKVK